jgi:proline dehydrogenase
MKEKQPKQQQQHEQQQQQQQQQQNQHQTTTTKPTILRPKRRTQQKLRFNYEARNSATGSQRVQQPKSSTMAEKLKAQLCLHSRPKKKGNFTNERKGEKKTNYSPANILQLLLQLQHVTRLFFFHFFLFATTIITNKTQEEENDDHIISNPQLKNLTLTQTT